MWCPVTVPGVGEPCPRILVPDRHSPLESVRRPSLTKEDGACLLWHQQLDTYLSNSQWTLGMLRAHVASALTSQYLVRSPQKCRLPRHGWE